MILSSKILFYVGIYLAYYDIGLRKRLTFYQNFGLSKTALILISFLIDTFITVIFIKLLRLF
ncbi:hypothetical protein LV92_03867 [Arenibacter echinorum]|uniref:Uncharacterized protein n=1 Tax=Arenibacter echinorum TaxID=440515 RepID=A0A327QUB1_9FLAO|nr:hypothetical protein LV92_03867 [Arenibacter echinorum]